MDVAQFLLGDLRVALVDAVMGAAVGEEVLGRGDDLVARQQVRLIGRTLQPANHGPDIGRDKLGVGRIALVRTAPAIVLRHRHRRRESPFLSGDAHFLRGRGADLLDQRRVAHRAEADVVGKDRRADDVGMAVDRVDTPDDGDADAALRCIDGGEIERVGCFQPLRRRGEIIAVGAAVAAHEDRSEVILVHVLRLHAAQVRLDQLANLLLQRHPPEQAGDLRLDRRVARHRITVLRPDFRMGEALALGRSRSGSLRLGG